MTFEYVRISDRAIRQVCCFVNRHYVCLAIQKVRKSTLSDTTVDCQHVEMLLCVCFPSGFVFNWNPYHTSLLEKHQNDNTIPQ